jgi:hypothetical protein
VIAIGRNGLLLIRNFQLVTCDVDVNMIPVGDTDRLDLVRRPGINRDATSTMCISDERRRRRIPLRFAQW